MSQIRIAPFPTAYGELVLGSFEEQLYLCDWKYRAGRNRIDERIKTHLGVGFTEGKCPVIREAQKQLLQYFRSEREEFEIPLILAGSDFQKQVWNAVLQIPYGRTESYGRLATRIGSPGSTRAVASANGANALAIFVPCHRVIGSNGEMTGYAGGKGVKRRLLNLETTTGQREINFPDRLLSG